MMDFNERVIPGISANFLYQEAFARYVFARKFIKKNSLVLDVGCGTGYGTAYLGEGTQIIGIDKDREAVRFAKKHYGEKAEFSQGSAEKLDFLEKFDAISAFEVIEHLRAPNAFLSQVKKALKIDGLLFISTPNRNMTFPGARSPYHVKEYNYEEFRKLLKNYFKSVRIYGQVKSKRAQKGLDNFMVSQKARQTFVNSDFLEVRKVIPKSIKEKIWKYLGNLFGRRSQEALSVKDFPIKSRNVRESNYFVAICKK